VRKIAAACGVFITLALAPPAAAATPAIATGGLDAALGDAPAPMGRAVLSADGRTAIAPPDAPKAVRDAIAAANQIVGKPYLWGGGHGRWRDRGYDCSGTVSYALHGGRLLASPLASGALMSWGRSGAGRWITVYAHGGHAYAVIAGLRLDTSGPGESGPRWRPQARSSRGFVARHPRGL
jgi:cell wall-associated NlpC family hydrolase